MLGNHNSRNECRYKGTIASNSTFKRSFLTRRPIDLLIRDRNMFVFARVVCGATIGLLLCVANVYADESLEFKRLLAEHSYAIELRDGGLSGPGADLIMRDAADTQFVALGEEHYNFIIPDITTALFTSLQDHYGYHYFMTEQDPVMMERFSQKPARGDLAKVQSLAQTYPMGVTFNSDEELRMLAEIGRISKAAEDPIWGCDQASGVTHILDQLLQETTAVSSVAAIKELRATAAAKEAVRDYSKGHYIFDAPTENFTALKATLDTPAGSHAEWLIDAVINSSRIFGFYKNGNNKLLPGYYENNRFREEHLKDLCLAKYRSTEKTEAMPKVLMKFGSWHLYEGLSPTRMHTIGDFFSNVARFNGNEFLSIHFVSRPENPEESMKDYGFIWPFINSLDPSEMAVIDLRPFRRYPNRNLVQAAAGEEWVNTYREDFMRLVYGYDLIFFVGETRAATFTVVPKSM